MTSFLTSVNLRLVKHEDQKIFKKYEKLQQFGLNNLKINFLSWFQASQADLSLEIIESL